ncbi:uncharacterized protein LOC118416942 isoform X1 [Branchiostoma floridae]|uniref:Uncharacterized protein LOC118416942 isoform X1 n=1 Tax=Branchiostoma floridae TaxID=7739 RepID=A0A9J7MTB4_BRAFL|nr:uncharacterized protein LOC118416942 isoform X1 [Branchiostoma floridae]
MAGSGRCFGLIALVSGVLLAPILANQRRDRDGPRPPHLDTVTPPPHREGGALALGSCRQGTHHYGNRCYDVSKERVDYDTAVERCSGQNGGKLVTFKTAKIMDGLAHIFSDCRFPLGVAFGKAGKKVRNRGRPPPKRCKGRQRNPKSKKIPPGFLWIGLRRNGSGTADRPFRFSDGSPLGTFRRWINGQAPRPNAEDGKDCVAARIMNNQGWKRFTCSHPLRYICQSEMVIRQNGGESTGNSLTTEVSTSDAVGTTGDLFTYVTDGLPARQSGETPTPQGAALQAETRAGGAEKPSVNLWLLLPGLQITGMLILMVWGTLFAWKITEGGTRPVSATSHASVSAASDVPISEQVPKHFEGPD